MNAKDSIDDEKLVTVATRPTEVEATILVNVLQDEGIKAVITGGFTAGFRAEAPGWVRVQTFARDEARAKTVISELKPLSQGELESLEGDFNDADSSSGE